MGERRVNSEAERLFARAYAHYEPFIRRYVARRVEPSAVDDVVADVFMAAWRRFDDVPADALPWLYRTAYNHIGTYYRGRGRRTSLLKRITLIEARAFAEPLVETIDAARIHAVLAALPEIDAEILLLAVWEELSIGEIARVLDISTTATRVRKHRATRRFTQLWNTDHSEGEDLSPNPALQSSPSPQAPPSPPPESPQTPSLRIGVESP